MQLVREERRSIIICDMLPTRLYCRCCKGTDILRVDGGSAALELPVHLVWYETYRPIGRMQGDTAMSL